jgi:8-oxo-dGTP pyrophosphatase MutT (NUDIX family)
MSLVYTSPPEFFCPTVQVSACFCFAQDKLLLLQMNSQKKDLANLWGAPAGKILSGESAKDAVFREMFEETGIRLLDNDVIFIKTVYVKYPKFDFVFHIFKNIFVDRPKILVLSSEHQAFKWVSTFDAINMNLIPGEKECIQICCEKNKTNKNIEAGKQLNKSVRR